MRLAIYRILDGEILRRVEGPEDQMWCQAGNGEEFYLNCPDTATHIIDNTPVRICFEETLEGMKIEKCKEINRCRDREEESPFEYLGKMFDADEKSVKRLTLATQAAQSALLSNNTFTITWTCADNTTIDLNQTQMLGVLEAMMMRGVTIHEKARELKALANLATTIEDLQLIKW